MAAIGRLGHYAAVTDMKGFGDAILEQAYAAGFLRSPADFYSFTWEQIAALEKCGEKLGRKLVAEVDKKRTLDLATFLRALGLGELGKHVSKILAKQYPSLDAVLAVTEPELAAIHSIGDIIARAVVAGLKESSALITELRKHVTIAVSQAPSAGSAPGVAASGPFAGQSFVFTGKMASLERKAAAAQVEELGGVAADSVSRTLSYLVVGDDKSGAKSTKEKAAEKLLGDGGALKVISETEFLKMVESARDRG